MKYAFFLLCFFNLSLFAQQYQSTKEHKKIASAAKVLAQEEALFAYDSIPYEHKIKAVHNFIPHFVATLKISNSFYYPFDSLKIIKKVYPPDSSFRIFTWQIKNADGTYHNYGAIQHNSTNLKLNPLFDFSDTMIVKTQEILAPSNWFGCIYYSCMQHTINNKTYYTLFGFDNIDFVSNQKIIEILSFDEHNNAQFGAPIIIKTDSNGVSKTFNRFFIQYNEKASVHLNYNAEKEMIVFDHLTAPSAREEDAPFTYIPDGTYEGFKWENDHWQWVEKVFHYAINELDKPPVPKPILDDRE